MSLRNQNVAVIGLGAMGLPIAANLAKAGVSTQGWNRSEDPRLEAAKVGITAVADVSHIDAAIVLVLLPDLPQLKSVLDAGLKSALKSGDFLVIMSTVSPVAVKELASELVTSGIQVVDAPMSGGVEGAKAATLSLMVGATAEQFQALLPTFEKIGKTIKLMGPLGSGEVAKACNQIIVATTLTGISEAIALAKRSGLDLEALFDILAGGYAASRIIDVKRQKFVDEDYSSMGSAKNQLKDLNIILDAGQATGTALPISAEVKALFESLIADDKGDLDHSAIITEIEKRSKN